MSDGSPEDPRQRRHLVVDAHRLQDVELKHDRVRRLLASTNADAVLLQDPANIAWFTAGADVFRFTTDSCQTSLYITDEARLFATNAVDSTLIFEREVFGLGFQLKQREWFQSHGSLIDDLSRSRKVISDSGYEGTRNASRRIARLRLPLTVLEVDRLRRLSKVLTHAVEVTAGNLRSGMTEADIAGEVSHRLLKRTVTPVRIQVCADGRNQRYRHWTYGEDPVRAYVSVSCVARRWGLHVAVTRTAAVDEILPELAVAHQKAALVHATGMYFSRNGRQLSDVWPKVRRIYEKFGMGSEWQLADQADVIGYRPGEIQLTPDADFRIEAPVALFWHPTVDVAMAGDTLLVTESGVEQLTRSETWPELPVKVKGHSVPCAGVLRIGRAMAELGEVEKRHVTESPFASLNFDDPMPASRLDSIWEMEPATGGSVFDDDDSPYSGESVLD